MTVVVSVDLALRRGAELGVAVLRVAGAGAGARAEGASGGVAGIAADLVAPPFDAVPPPEALAAWLDEVARGHGASLLCVDGPSAWKSPASALPHARRAERLLNTPGKTGCAPDGVKPRGYLAFTRASIALFEALGARGWRFPEDATAVGAPPRVPTMVETFPTAAWRRLGLAALPGRARGAEVVRRALEALRAVVRLDLDAVPTHDQLQAVVGGLAGVWWLRGEMARVELVGAPPVRGGHGWEEGWILVPAASPCPPPSPARTLAPPPPPPAACPLRSPAAPSLATPPPSPPAP
jgi:hypothetical protein